METLPSYLRSQFGFSDKNIEDILSKTTMRDKDLVKQKIDLYKEIFKVTDKELGMLVKGFPPILSYDINSEGPTSVKSKIKFYKETFNLTDAEIGKMIKSFPNILGYDINSEEPTSIKSKIKFYKESLNLTDAEIGKMIKCFPSILGCDIFSEEPTSIKSKIKFYKETFNLSDAEIGKMIKNSPSVLGLDITGGATSVNAKIQKLNEMGFLDKFIVNNPKMLSFPVQGLKIRYMLFKINDANRNQIGNFLMVNEKVVYARRRYMLGKNISIKSYPYYRQKRFHKFCPYTKEELIAKYPLTQEKALEVQEEYNKKCPDMPMQLTQDELSIYPKESEQNG